MQMKKGYMRRNAGLITTLLLIAVGVGLLAYFQVDLRALIGAAIRWIGAFISTLR
ncbi:MAG: hypothetical protein Q8R39_01950 [bacterium]|nr:hypothetical protein [bacterium]MDZ4285076.1 hypothetical protein [Patescibacteria group bacterium]